MFFLRYVDCCLFFLLMVECGWLASYPRCVWLKSDAATVSYGEFLATSFSSFFECAFSSVWYVMVHLSGGNDVGAMRFSAFFL